MSLTDLLNEGGRSNKADKVELALRKLNRPQLEAFQAVITDKTFSAAAIAHALNESSGIKPPIVEHQIRHFRRKLREGSVDLDSF